MVHGHKKLKIYQLAHESVIRIHKMSLKLPSFERFEEGTQIRRSSKSVSSNIVEGYALRRYKQDYIRYLLHAYASGMETVEHLEYLYETKSLKDKTFYESQHRDYTKLNNMLHNFIKAIESGHDSSRVGNINDN